MLDQGKKARAKKVSFDGLSPNKRAAVLKETQKNFGLNRRGAERLLRQKGGLARAFGRMTGKAARLIGKIL